MTHAELFTQLMQASAVAAGLLAWSSATILLSPRVWYWRASVAVMSSFVTVGVLTMMLGRISPAWFIGLCCGVVLLTIITSSQLWLGLAQFIQLLNVRRPARVFGLLSLLVVGLGWGLVYHHYEQTQLAQADDMLAKLDARNPPKTIPADMYGVTDLGQTIELELPVDPANLADLEDLEESSVPIQQYQHNWLIRRGPPDDTSNCHGWVFTNGKYNIAGKSVTTILEQNSYVQVTRIEAGDLVVYRNTNGEISHTGIVRTVFAENDVLVESKWGRMGVYLHPVEKSCYGHDFEYYRCERGTHLINLLTENTKSLRSTE